jgi:hypothetical protein
VRGPAGRVEQADHVLAAARLDHDAAREQVARVEAARALDAQVALVVDVLHVEADFVDVARQQDALGLAVLALGALGRDEAAHRIDGDLVEERLALALEDLAHALLTPRHAGRFGERFEE